MAVQGYLDMYISSEYAVQPPLALPDVFASFYHKASSFGMFEMQASGCCPNQPPTYVGNQQAMQETAFLLAPSLADLKAGSSRGGGFRSWRFGMRLLLSFNATPPHHIFFHILPPLRRPNDGEPIVTELRCPLFFPLSRYRIPMGLQRSLSYVTTYLCGHTIWYVVRAAYHKRADEI